MPEVLTLTSEYGIMNEQLLGEPGDPIRERGGPILAKNAQVLERLCSSTVEKAQEISAGRMFTTAGKAAELERVGNAAMIQLTAEATVRRQSLDAALEQARKSIPGEIRATHVVDMNGSVFIQTDAAHRVAEARTMLRDADPALRQGFANQAADDGDGPTIFAIESMPEAEQIRLGFADLEPIRERYWRTVKPAAFIQIEEAQRILQLIQANIGTAERVLGDATGCTRLEDTVAANARTTVHGRPRI